MDFSCLNHDYAIAGHLQFTEPHHGFPWIAIDNDFATALISVYGAQVLSYQPKGAAEDLIFLSDRAVYSSGKAIRGGIPICWPWFGADPEGLGRSSHGFARDRHWTVRSTETTTTGATRVILGLTDSPDTRAIWDYAFDVAIAITVGASLDLELITRNTGTVPLTISQALHTYFNIGDIHHVKVLGLANLDYVDKVDGGNIKTQLGEVGIAEEVDRIYRHAPNQLQIEDPAFNRTIHITSQHSQTAIVWNPWAEKAAVMGDLGVDNYPKMLCVETANTDLDCVAIAPASQHSMGVSYHLAP